MAISGQNSANTAYTDLSALNQISVAGREDTAAGLKKVAKQFEAMFLNIMLKSMRESNKAFSEGSYLNSNEMEFYQQNFDDQMSVHLSAGKGIGLAENLYRQLLNQFDVKETNEEDDSDSTLLQNVSQHQLGQVAAQLPDFIQRLLTPEQPADPVPHEAEENSVDTPVQATPIADAIARVDDIVSNIAERFSSPADFIDRLYPAAKKAAAGIGVTPEVLLAQSALETGWGQKIVHDRSGNNSHNLFGIKADPSWQGGKSVADTLEFNDGVAHREKAAFRQYQSYQESFDDYVEFLKTNPRYRSALDHAASASAFVEKLQEAGYATDPVYAEKISRVLNSPVMRDALSLRNGS